jgi:hypothetical protein
VDAGVGGIVQPVEEHLDVIVLYMFRIFVSVAASGRRSCVESIDRKQPLQGPVEAGVFVTS